MMIFFYISAILLTFLGYKSLRGGFDYLVFFRHELAKPKSEFTPFCSIIVPCRGLDEDLELNLEALFRQDFPAYEILFAVDSAEDEAVPLIQNLIDREQKTPEGNSEKICVKAKLIVAGKAENEGQKVHNLREAVLHVAEKSEIFVFVDSDARPATNWLRNLIAPLQDANIGAATAYRWFIAKNPFDFASQFRSLWNASIASQLGANTKSNFCWGGSTAISRRIFERLEIREKWRGTLSDDFAVTRAMQAEGLPIVFVPNCLTATVENCTFAEMVEFTTRQMKITRVYAPHFWKLSFVGATVFSATFWSGFALLFFTSDLHLWLTATFLLLNFSLGAGKAYLRLEAVKLVLPMYRRELNQSYLWHIGFWQFSPLLFLYNCLAAAVSRKIVWRGIIYEMKSPTETVIFR